MNRTKVSFVILTGFMLLSVSGACSSTPGPGTDDENQSGGASQATGTTSAEADSSSRTTSSIVEETSSGDTSKQRGYCFDDGYLNASVTYHRGVNQLTLKSVAGIPVGTESWSCRNTFEPEICCPTSPDYMVHVKLGGIDPSPGIYEFGKNGISAKYFARFDHEGRVPELGGACRCTRYPTHRDLPIPHGRLEIISKKTKSGEELWARIVVEELAEIKFSPIWTATPQGTAPEREQASSMGRSARADREPSI